jgi:predicted ATP-binding protein involved in virulence
MKELQEFKQTPPQELAPIFSEPPLVGEEKREDYDRFFANVVAALKPADAIAWIYSKDFVDLSWEILRERKIKASIVKHYETMSVASALKEVNANNNGVMAHLMNYEPDARQWATNQRARQQYNKQLSRNGFESTEILAQAYIEGGPNIDLIDRRIASYELRRIALLKTIEQYNDAFARRLKTVVSEVTEGEFTEVTG